MQTLLDESQTNYRLSQNLKRIIVLLIVASIIVKMQADLFYYDNLYYPNWSIFRHILFGSSLILLLLAFIKSKNQKVFVREFLMLCGLGFFILFLSIIYVSINGGGIFASIKSLYLMYSGVIAAFFILNLYRPKEIISFMKVLLVTVLLLYFYGNIEKFFVPSNYLEIDFWESKSPFESSAFSGYLYGFMMFFTLAIDNKKWAWISVIGNLLAFKRVNILFSLLFLCISVFKKGKRKIPKILLWFLIILFSLLPMLQYELMTPDNLYFLANKLGFSDVHYLLMGRDKFFYQVLNSGYKSFGFGSASARLQSLSGNGMEMDGLSTYMELGLFGSSAISLTFWKITGRKSRGIFLMLVFFINYLTSSQINSTYTMMFLVISVAFIKEDYWSSGKYNQEVESLYER